ncbi:GGDEF domain-containing protein [Actimicrobium sp. CCI2.3]|uniref:GGDEF domain-containing protein n=1 Tax=Actimicrobium sp. CCI2.3 TaxID=3048616 RepID=UPI002AB47BB7|nr:GGDEF domain-containing protein [Actimicrobium sp. CCI2.3]MDY7573476.1 GGDEF domain-containing protein [Actimicrobium sp. CCI2.3]MEB0022657.1 GGDEF domain-containing protein [Actimicrobium sp. CCI2.3]
MKFNLFSRFNLLTTVMATTRIASRPQRTDSERANLAGALNQMLEQLPLSEQLSSGAEQLCRAIVDATGELRFVWIGMREEPVMNVAPLVVEGEYASDCDDWSLPSACFDSIVPYSQAALENVAVPNDFPSLFAPWRNNMDGCTAHCALAIPLRSGRAGVAGLMVFYAADIDYFSRLGLVPFQAFSHVAEFIWKQSHLSQSLTQQIEFDGLTGLMNRRKTVFVLTAAIDHATRAGEPLSVLLCRVQGFDKLNDVYGWFDADAILAAFASLVGARMAPAVQAGRWTGVEFVYILQGCDAEQAGVLAGQLSQYLQGQAIHVKNLSIRLTVGVGVATHTPASSGVDDLIQQAIQQMLPVTRPLF